MIDAIAQFFGVLLSFIYNNIFPNLGFAIIVLTILVKLVTFPLNNKQIQSAKRMQQLQPEMKKIQEKFKNDREKQNQAMTEFMKENDMNPLAGCLPLVIQFPILIGVFRLLRDPEMIASTIGERFSPFLFPNMSLESLKINLLELPYVTGAEGFDIGSLFSQASLLYLFPLLAGLTTYLYSKMSMTADSTQKTMLYMMPVMITVFSFSFPIGLVIYWILNNLFSVGQHKLIVHMEKGSGSGAEDISSPDKGKGDGKKGKKGKGKK